MIRLGSGASALQSRDATLEALHQCGGVRELVSYRGQLRANFAVILCTIR
jgi:hypothetical protein